MGTYKQGILGPFSGKVGQVVGSFWNGVSYMRSLAPNVANPRTVDQQRVRGNFAKLSEVLRPLRVAIRAGFVGLQGQSAWSAAMSANWRIENALQPDVLWPSIAHENVEVTNGTTFFAVEVVKGRTGDFEVTWTPITDNPSLAAGSVGVAIMNNVNNRVEFFRADMSAAATTISVAGLATGEGDTYDVWAFGYSRDESTMQSFFEFSA